MMVDDSDEMLRAGLNLETAKIAWSELQFFFATGAVVGVSPSLDLIEVALQFSRDNKPVIERWMREDKLGKVSDEQAKAWFDADAQLWSVVVRPWVLVQPV